MATFLNETLMREVYIQIPEGVNEQKGKVLKLNKALYRLKESLNVGIIALTNLQRIDLVHCTMFVYMWWRWLAYIVCWWLPNYTKTRKNWKTSKIVEIYTQCQRSRWTEEFFGL